MKSKFGKAEKCNNFRAILHLISPLEMNMMMHALFSSDRISRGLTNPHILCLWKHQPRLCGNLLEKRGSSRLFPCFEVLPMVRKHEKVAKPLKTPLLSIFRFASSKKFRSANNIYKKYPNVRLMRDNSGIHCLKFKRACRISTVTPWYSWNASRDSSPRPLD